MNRFGSSLVLFAVGLGSLFGTSGCELQKCKTDEGESAVCLKSLTRFEGAEVRPDVLSYSAATDVTVNGIYGDIHVVEGTPGEVAVAFEPFNYRAHDAEDQARDELANNFDYSFESTGTAIVVSTGRHDATNGLGADITVFLPPEFDGVLTLDNDSDGPVNPGNIHANFVGMARGVDLATDSLGDCSVDAAGSVHSTFARCDGSVTATGVADHLDIRSTGLENDVLVVLTSVAGADAGGSVTGEDGDIEIDFPTGADFTVQAQATADGSVSSSALEDACVGDIAADNSKSFTCGAGGPNYVVTAGTDGVGPSSVTLELAP